MKFLKNAWYVVMWAEQLLPGVLEKREVLSEPLVIYRLPNGSPAILEDRCPHRFAPLHMGALQDNGSIECAYHGLHFNHEGNCVFNPHGKGVIPIAAQVKSFPVHEAYSLIWVWMGNDEPDISLIPDLSVIDRVEERYITRRDYLEMKADYQLVVDNLLDLSHTVILHRGILGNNETASAEIKVYEKNDVVTVSRWMPAVEPPGLFDMLYKRDGKPVDHWTDISWLTPCYMINDAGVTEIGAPRSEGTGIYGLHLLTPVNERCTRYHFAAIRQNPMVFSDDVEQDLMSKLTELRRKAFVEEDLPMIEAQQSSVDSLLSHRAPVLLDVDSGAVRYKRILDKMIKEE